MANWSGTSMAPIFAGTSQHGFRFAATEMSHFGGGGGARVDADGVDTSGIVFNTTPNVPNIEDQEAEYPVLYLFRRHLPDSGGPGKYRGGRAGELAYTVHDAPDGRLEGLFAGTGAEMPNAIGIAGGFPGAAIRVARVVETDLAGRLGRGALLPARLEDVTGRREILECKHERSPILAGEVWYHSWQAGAGYGDPLEREPARVAEDVARGAVSAGAARAIYGIVLDAEGAVDPEATTRARAALRRARLAAAAVPPASDAVLAFEGTGSHRFGDALVLALDERRIACARCEVPLGASGENLLPQLKELVLPVTAAGPVRGEDYERGRFGLRLLLCPACGHALDAHLAFAGAPRPSMRIRYR
jgi:N-methylhydantoinase B